MQGYVVYTTYNTYLQYYHLLVEYLFMVPNYHPI